MAAMSFTGVKNLDHSIATTHAWLAEIAAEFGTGDRQFAYRVTRAWLHALTDRLPVPVAANLAAQLPEVLRGVFYGTPGSAMPTCRGRPGWSPGRCAATCPPALWTRRSTCWPRTSASSSSRPV